MKILFLFIAGLGLAFIFKNSSCVMDRNAKICNESCQDRGLDYGQMPDAWNCECVKSPKSNKVKIP